MKRKWLLLIFAVFAVISPACSAFGDGGTDFKLFGGNPTPTPSGEFLAGGSAGFYSKDIPVPSDFYNYMELGEDIVNYNTSIRLDGLIAFYRLEFSALGYQERESATITDEKTFSITFDGHPSGRAIVIHAVDLGTGSLNVNAHYEDK